MSQPLPTARAPRPLQRIIRALLVSAIDAALLSLALGGITALLHDARALALLAIWTASSLILGLMRPERAPEIAERGAEPRAVLLALVAIPLFIPPIAAWTVRLGFGVIPGGASTPQQPGALALPDRPSIAVQEAFPDPPHASEVSPQSEVRVTRACPSRRSPISAGTRARR